MPSASRRSKATQTGGTARPHSVAEGLVHHQAGRLDRAEAIYLQALKAQPNNADALYLLSVLRHQQGNALEAVNLLTNALAIEPNHPEACYHLGVALRDLGRPAEAEASYREALRLRPDYPEAHNNLGVALRDLGRPAEAKESYQVALHLRPDYPKAHNNLGVALRDLGRPAEAEASYREALRLRPDYPEAHNNQGNVLSDLGRLPEAEASYREAVRLLPDCPETHNNLGGALSDLGRPAEALACYERALAIRPDDVSAHFGRSRPLLLRGEYAEGWREFEWRWRGGTAEEIKLRGFAAPQWQGEDVAGKTLLLHAEQGFGDTLQFCRYASLVGASARVILEVQPALVRLCSSLAGVAQVVARGEQLPAFDLHCPLMSLPLAVGTTLDTIPFSGGPYLAANPKLVAGWRERLAGLDGLRVGLVWAGSLRPEAELSAIDRRRSITLAMMAPLGETSGVSFVSLQKGEPAAQSANAALGLELHDFTVNLQDFADTAALIETLDLVISVDTSVAHLAGALGKPIWLLNRFDTCWRWLLNRDDSPWYPQLRQFRQPSPGDWDSVVCAVRDALQRRAANT
jgi:tetratricopeptide (TPR) repeat protein